MIFQGKKEIVEQYIGKKPIIEMYVGKKLIWQTVKSCFGKGYWINDAVWDNNDIWKNN